MTYRDNDVFLPLNGGYSLISGTYTLNSFSITNGQDPDGHIYVGLKAAIDSNGKMSFSIGRKGSESVANWFNDRISASQNTFNHTAGELNFAFIGTLELTIKGNILGSHQQNFTFLNVAIAQGHSGTSNNWWFGGQNCSYIQNDQVTCKGANSKGAEVSFVFLRGGNNVSTIDVTPTTFVDTTNWMKKISDSLRLDQIMMPGSHDAGMSELHHCAPPVGAGDYTKTQSGSIGQQLNDGSRYFDIRVDYDYNTLVTYHRTDGWGCNGQDLKVVLDQTQAFLIAHPTETAILKFSHIRDYQGHDPAITKQKINDLLNSYDVVIYKNPLTTINLAAVTLGNTRGKMILVFDYNEYINSAMGRFRYMDGNVINPNANITVYDKYSETPDYEVMKADQLKKWKEYGGMGSGYLFLLSWTLTANPPGATIEQLASEANSKLYDVLYDQIITDNSSKPNIVYIDFLNNTIAQSIILFNF
jgi:hypothetical protein